MLRERGRASLYGDTEGLKERVHVNATRLKVFDDVLDIGLLIVLQEDPL